MVLEKGKQIQLSETDQSYNPVHIMQVAYY